MKKLTTAALAASTYLALAKSAFAVTPVLITSPVASKVGTLGDVFGLVFNFLIAIVGGLAVIFIVIGGIRYILAGGDPKATDSAKNQITGALIGLIIALLAVVIIKVIGTFIGTTDLSTVGV